MFAFRSRPKRHDQNFEEDGWGGGVQTTMPRPMISAHGVTKFVGSGKRRKVAIDDISVDFAKGRFVGILGGPKSGKTSLIELLTGNEQPDVGHVHHGMTVSWPIGSRQIFNKTLSVRANVKFLAGMYGAWPPAILDMVIEMGRLRRTDVDKALREVPDEVHSRALAIVALAMKFDCYVADEVFCRGSRQFRDFMLGQYESLRGQHSFIIATRNVQIIRDLCDDCYLIEGGQLRHFAKKGDAIRAFKFNKATDPIEDEPSEPDDSERGEL